MAIALVFGLTSLRYPIGQFSRAGPGLFPLSVSGLLFLIGLFTVVRSRFVERVPLDFKMKNIAIILASLCGFAVISHWLPFLLFSGYAGALADRVNTRRMIQLGMLIFMGVFVGVVLHLVGRRDEFAAMGALPLRDERRAGSEQP